MSLMAELNRRKVFKVGAAYLVVAWLAVQVASIALPAFEAPAWVLRVFILVLMLGLPITLVLTWAIEAGPEGLKFEPSPVGSKRMYAISAGLAALALVWYFLGAPALRPGEKAVASADSAAPAAVASAAPATPAISDKSIAVLAFADMSPGRDQEYLGDGIAEEILNALAKLEGLKVAGRTSAFHFKGRNEDLRTIGQTLGVAHVLEGSVRKQGERVRITAQLIRVGDGFHLWSETYDGDLADVFALQERIARAVTDQLEVMLEAGDQAPLVRTGTRNPEAYSLYLQASVIFNRRDGDRFPEAQALLEQAIALDPGYARAWSRLAAMQSLSINFRTVDFDGLMATVQAAAERASALDPDLGEPHAVLAMMRGNGRHYLDERVSMARALELEPNDMTSNVWYGVSLSKSGYLREAEAQLDRALALDPLLPIGLLWRAVLHIRDGELDIAERQLRLAADGGLSFVGIGEAELAQARGRREAGIAALTRGLRQFATGFPPEAPALFARACFDDAAAQAEARLMFAAAEADQHIDLPAVIPYVYFCTGETERALTLLRDRRTSNDALVTGALLRGRWPEALRSPLFPEVARDIGWAALWDQYGPPDLCRKAENGDYVCQ